MYIVKDKEPAVLDIFKHTILNIFIVAIIVLIMEIFARALTFLIGAPSGGGVISKIPPYLAAAIFGFLFMYLFTHFQWVALKFWSKK